MPQLPQRHRLDLADAFARDIEEIAHFFESMVAPIFQAEAQFKHFAFAVGEQGEGRLDLFAQYLTGGGIERREGVFILDKITQRTGVFVADGTVNRDWLLSGTEHAVNFLGGCIEAVLEVTEWLAVRKQVNALARIYELYELAMPIEPPKPQKPEAAKPPQVHP